MGLTRQYQLGDDRAYVFDAELPDETLKSLYQELTGTRPYTRSEYANIDRVQIRHWATEFDVNEFLASEVGKQTVKRVAECYPGQPHNAYRAYCNVATYGDMLSVHNDCPSSHRDVTAMWFIADEWQRDWRGEFLMFDGATDDAVAAVTPKPGRLCLFPGRIPHAGTPPSRLCYKPRLTLVCKFAPAETSEGVGADHEFKSVEATFAHVARNLVALPAEIRAVYKFVISGNGGGTWVVRIQGADRAVTTVDGPADLTIRTSVETFLDGVNGRLNIAKAFILRRIKVEGNLELVGHLRTLLGRS